MFAIEVDAPNRLLRVTMSGFMTPEEVHDFSDQEQAVLRRLGWESGEFLLLVDASGCAIQSQDTVAALSAIVLRSPRKARRIAVARGTSLTRMQTRRIVVVRDEAMIFETVAEAEAWILADPPAHRLHA